jgi:hypothetical protein
MKRSLKFLSVFMFVGITAVTTEQTMAQVYNYDPYTDKDLEGEFERPRKLQFGMRLGAVLGGAASTAFYNGLGTYELGDGSANLYSIEDRLNLGGANSPTRSSVLDLLNVTDFYIPADGYPTAARYDPVVLMGVRVLQRFNLENSIVFDADFVRLRSRAAWQLVTNLLPDQGQGTEDRRDFGIFGEEERFMVHLGYRTASPIDKSASYVIGLGVNMVSTRITDHYVVIEGGGRTEEFALITSYNAGQTGPATGALTGTGFGAYIRVGAEAYVPNGSGVELTYRLGYDAIKLGRETFRTLDHALVLTWLMPPPKISSLKV